MQGTCSCGHAELHTCLFCCRPGHHIFDCCHDLPKGSPAYRHCGTEQGCQERGCCFDQNIPPHNWCSGFPHQATVAQKEELRPAAQKEEAMRSRDDPKCSPNHEGPFTYNEGLMLGAAVALGTAPGVPATLREIYARDAARFAGHLVRVQTELGVLHDDCEWTCNQNDDTPATDCQGALPPPPTAFGYTRTVSPTSWLPLTVYAMSFDRSHAAFKGIAIRELGRFVTATSTNASHAAGRAGPLLPVTNASLVAEAHSVIEQSADAVWAKKRVSPLLWTGTFRGKVCRRRHRRCRCS